MKIRSSRFRDSLGNVTSDEWYEPYLLRVDRSLKSSALLIYALLGLSIVVLTGILQLRLALVGLGHGGERLTEESARLADAHHADHERREDVRVPRERGSSVVDPELVRLRDEVGARERPRHGRVPGWRTARRRPGGPGRRGERRRSRPGRPGG